MQPEKGTYPVREAKKLGIVEIVPGSPTLSLQSRSQVCVACYHSAPCRTAPQRYGGMHTFERKLLIEKLIPCFLAFRPLLS